MSTRKKSFTKNHLLAALLVGTLDITAACIQYYFLTGKTPLNVLKYVASGAFGAGAYTGGNAMIFWGLLFHYIVATSFAFLFFALVARFPSLLNQKILLAIVYGTFMWAFMRFAVLPLSKVSLGPLTLVNSAVAILILIVCICIPLILVASKERNTT